MTPSHPTNNQHRVAIIGAGIAGLTCADSLSKQGFDVTVFDKARGPAGRTSTRRTDTGLQFDHGCQYISPKDERFREAVLSWVDAGVVEPWHGRVVDLQNGKLEERAGSDRYVGVPGMNAICKHIAANLTVQTQTRITSLTRGEKWTVASEEESFGNFHAVVVAIPAVQAAELLSGVSELADTIAKVEMTPCWTTMLAFETPIDVSFDAALVHDSAIAWMARNSSKPSRPASTDGWVVQASAEWSKENLERDAADVGAELLAECLQLVEHPLRVPTHNVAHRWRYAVAAAPLGAESLLDRDLSLAICGDWCLGNRVEHAFLSGLSAAEATSRCIGVRPPS